MSTLMVAQEARSSLQRVEGPGGRVTEPSASGVTRSMSKETTHTNQYCCDKSPWQDKATLQRLYYGEGLSLSEIGEKLGCCLQTVHNWMVKHDLERRPDGGHIQYPTLHDPARLRNLYIEQELTMAEIAEKLGCDEGAVYHAIDGFDIETRMRGRPAGPDHPNFVDGGLRYYGPEWSEIRENIIERDDKQCRRCGKTRREHHEEIDRDLTVHHIIRRNDFDDWKAANESENLITLCLSCHVTMEGLPIDNRSNP